jgi:outer membrane protein OmpA-like peptidoglycan-associated protein
MPCHYRHLILLCPLLLTAFLTQSQQRRTDTLILHFAFNSHHIQPEDEAAIAASFRELRLDSFYITGYTDKVGTAAYNQHLSEQRANAAAAYLRTYHSEHPAPVSKVAGAGVAPTPELSDSENRRVEIIYYSVDHHTPDTIRRNAPPGVTAQHPDSIVVVKTQPADSGAPTDSTRPAAILALRHINFIVDTPIPTDSTRRILPEFVTELMQFKDHQLEIDGYVNSIVPLRGKNDPLFILSVRRAKFIYDYLVNAGFDPGKLTYKGMGNASPVNPHPMTTKEMNANMRVEIKVF